MIILTIRLARRIAWGQLLSVSRTMSGAMQKITFYECLLLVLSGKQLVNITIMHNRSLFMAQVY